MLIKVRTDEAVNSMLLSAPPSLSGEGATMDWQPSITPVEERSESKSQEDRSEASTPNLGIHRTTPKADSPIRVVEYVSLFSIEGIKLFR